MSNEKMHSFRWKNYAQNGSKRFFEFLQKSELVDVTLMAEGHYLGAHRLVLSAISPYFHAMFSKSNQHFVLLDDISRRSLEYLIAYIYTGDIQVESRDLQDFLKAVKKLNIQGIDGIDENSNLNNSKSMPMKSEPNESIKSSIEREDIRVMPKRESAICDHENDANSNNISQNNFNEQNSNDSSESENFDDSYEDANWTPDSVELIADDEENEESYCTCESPYPDETNVDQSQNVCLNVACPTGRFNDADADLECPPSKRARIGSDEFNIVADIRLSSTNKENLFYNGYKFYKNKSSRTGSTFWQCTRYTGKDKCRAYAHTKLINGVAMMKLSAAEHTHIPQTQIDESNLSEFNIIADIRLSSTNKENLFYNGYKFCKNMTSRTGLTFWVCTRHGGKDKCRAYAHTKLINGVIMMKLSAAEHTHIPQTQIDESNLSEFNTIANICRNDRNKENLHHDGYKYTKGIVGKASINWMCANGGKCKARATTKTVNGVVMVKPTGHEHNHERNTN